MNQNITNHIIKYIADHSVDEMVKAVTSNGKNIERVIQQIKDSRVEYQKKSQLFQDELSKHLQRYEVGMVLEAKEDCMNNFRKGQKVEITLITVDGEIVVDGLAAIDEDMIRKFFYIVGSK